MRWPRRGGSPGAPGGDRVFCACAVGVVGWSLCPGSCWRSAGCCFWSVSEPGRPQSLAQPSQGCVSTTGILLGEQKCSEMRMRMRMLEEGWAARGCSCSQSRVTLLPGLVLDHSHAPFCRECPFAGNVFGNQPDQELLRVSPGCVQKSLGSEQGMCSKPQCPPVPGLVPLADVLKTIWGVRRVDLLTWL